MPRSAPATTPSHVGRESSRLVRGAQRTQLVGAAHDTLKRRHHRRAVAPAAPIRADTYTLDIAGAQRPPTVQQPPLDHGRVTDHVASLPHEGVHSAQGLLPVAVNEVAFEDHVKESTRRLESRSIQVGGVDSAQLGHAPSLQPQ